jgi:hypothetical protein
MSCSDAAAEGDKTWWNTNWESRVALDIEKAVEKQCPAFAAIVPVGFLGLPEGTNWNSVRVIGPAGKELPAQTDDLDGDGKITGSDELVFLMDIKEKASRAYLYFSADKKVARSKTFSGTDVRASFNAEGDPQFDNGAIRMSQRRYSYHLSNEDRWVSFLDGDGALSFDAYNFSGSKVAGWKTEVAARGPVRTVIRRISTAITPTRKARETQHPIVPARVVHEWHIYRNKKECFVSSKIENRGTGKEVLVVARGRNGLYVTPGGKYTPEDFWTAMAKPWKTWTKSMTGGRKIRRASSGMVQGLRLSEGWFDAYTDGPSDKPRVNVGLVIHPLSVRHSLWAGERDRRFWLVVWVDKNWPKIPPRGSLWVGFWVCPHEGRPEEIRDFWQARRKIDVIPGAIETRR